MVKRIKLHNLVSMKPHERRYQIRLVLHKWNRAKSYILCSCFGYCDMYPIVIERFGREPQTSRCRKHQHENETRSTTQVSLAWNESLQRHRCRWSSTIYTDCFDCFFSVLSLPWLMSDVTGQLNIGNHRTTTVTYRTNHLHAFIFGSVTWEWCWPAGLPVFWCLQA